MFKKYSTKVIKLYKNGDKIGRSFQIETFYESKELDKIKTFLLKNIDKIIEQNWGKFSKEFIIHHILKSQIIKILRNEEKIVAFASASYKNILDLPVLYLEFTVVNEKYQGYNLSTKLNGDFIAEEVVRGLISRKFKPLNVVTITRNMRVVGALSRMAKSIYPDPEKFKKYNKLRPADNTTWKIVNEILRESWNPDRKIEREGCVLVGSYKDTPWLINPKVQNHYKNSIKEMGKKYLKFHERADREFIVRVSFNLYSVIKYYLWSFSYFKLKHLFK
ncbi:MAG: hypothetical protein Q8P20_06835 [bacterium]|nr:hypothetical protein [bacterium]